MTQSERHYPELINDSRKQRISKGAGIKVKDIDDLLNKFEQSKQFAKMMKKGFKK